MKNQRLLVGFGILLPWLNPNSTASAQAYKYGSDVLVTQAFCVSAQHCNGISPGQLVETGGIGQSASANLNVSQSMAAGTVSFGGMGLPQFSSFTSSGDPLLRMNSNLYAFQTYTYTGSVASPFSVSATFHVDDSSTDGQDGFYYGGARYGYNIAIQAESNSSNVQTGADIRSLASAGVCGLAGVLGSSISSASLPGGEQFYSGTTAACGTGTLILHPGEVFSVTAVLQTPVVPGGFIDARNTFTTRLGDDLTTIQKDYLMANLIPSILAPVPELDTWIFMVIGASLVGALLRNARLRNPVVVRDNIFSLRKPQLWLK